MDEEITEEEIYLTEEELDQFQSHFSNVFNNEIGRKVLEKMKYDNYVTKPMNHNGPTLAFCEGRRTLMLEILELTNKNI